MDNAKRNTMRIVIKDNNVVTDDPCAICRGRIVSIDSPESFVKALGAPVCHLCVFLYEAVLYARLEELIIDLPIAAKLTTKTDYLALLQMIKEWVERSELKDLVKSNISEVVTDLRHSQSESCELDGDLLF